MQARHAKNRVKAVRELREAGELNENEGKGGGGENREREKKWCTDDKAALKRGFEIYHRANCGLDVTTYRV